MGRFREAYRQHPSHSRTLGIRGTLWAVHAERSKPVTRRGRQAIHVIRHEPRRFAGYPFSHPAARNRRSIRRAAKALPPRMGLGFGWHGTEVVTLVARRWNDGEELWPGDLVATGKRSGKLTLAIRWGPMRLQP